MSELCFCQRSSLTCIDVVRDGTEPPRGVYSCETLEEIRLRYPGAELLPIDEFVVFKEGVLTSAPTEIDAATYDKMMGVLPPEDLQTRPGEQSFKMEERLSGRITGIYCYVDGRYFTFSGLCSLRHEEIVRRCRLTAQRP